MTDILYRSDTVEVRRVAGSSAACQVVTFDCYHDEPGFDRPGFGESYFAHHDISAIHVLTHANDWYQYADMALVTAAVRSALVGAEHILAYGSSMGGYAAIRFADAIGAHSVLAISPQYSVDRRKVPFERRWMQDQRRIRFRQEIDGTIRPRARIVAVYDPELAQDRAHIARIAADTPIETLALAHAGHPAGGFLSDVGLLKPMVEQALGGMLDVVAVAREAEARREQSPTWLGERSGALAPGAEAIALAARAVALAPDSPLTHDRLACRLAEAGHSTQAIAAHRRAIALDASQTMPGYRWNLSKTLFAAGDVAGALAEARELQRISPRVAGHHRWAAQLRASLGDREGALADIAAAIREAPGNPGYRLSALSMRLADWADRLRRVSGATPRR